MTATAGRALIGRASELAALTSSIVKAVDGEAGPILVAGEAGIGKSTLLEHALEAARSRGLRTLAGSAREWTMQNPFAPVFEALSALGPAGEAAGLDRPDALGAEHDPRSSMVERLRLVIEEASIDQGLVLALEDMQWADEGTYALLQRLITGLDAMPLAVVMTTRPALTTPLLAHLVDATASAGEMMTLTALDPEVVDSIAELKLGARPGENLRALLGRAGGNPLFVTEMLDAVDQSESLTAHGDTIDATSITIPPSLSLTILSRLRTLPESVVELLRTAAVLGSSFDVSDLVAFTGRPATEVGRDLRVALEEGILEEGTHLGFRHDLIHDALYDDTPSAIRRALHAEAARVLEAEGRDPSHIALHVRRSARVGDLVAVRRLRRAAEAARVRSPSIAAELYEHALDLGGPSAPDRYEMRVARAEALVLAGRVTEAERSLVELLDERRGGPTERALLIDLSRALLIQRRAQTLVARLDAAARADDVPDGERALLLAHLATALMERQETSERGNDIAVEATELARTTGNRTAECIALVVRSGFASLSSPEEATALARAAVEIAEGGGVDGYAAINAMIQLAQLLSALDFVSEPPGSTPTRGDALLNAALRRAEEAGYTALIPQIHTALGTNALRWGDWDAAIVELETSIKLSDEISEDMGGDQRPLLARLLTDRGRRADAERLVAEYERRHRIETMSSLSVAMIAWARIEFLEEDGAPEQALGRALDSIRELRRRGADAAAMNLVLPAARVAAALDRDDAAAELVDLTGPMRARSEMWAMWDDVARAIHSRDADQCLELARTSGGVSYQNVRLVEEAAVVLLEHGRRAEAGDLLDDVERFWSSVGADGALERIRRRTGRRAPRPTRPVSGWEALTEAERRVADLMLERLLYREIADRLFISRRTVETHAARILRKLGVSSRWELEGVAQDRPVQPAPTSP